MALYGRNSPYGALPKIGPILRHHLLGHLVPTGIWSGNKDATTTPRPCVFLTSLNIASWSLAVSGPSSGGQAGSWASGTSGFFVVDLPKMSLHYL